MISVVVPVFNGLPYLAECVDSLKRQTDSEFEVVFVDDGSVDGSSEFCDQVCSDMDNWRVLHKGNAGLLLARCDGISLARGEYILFLDADDCLSPNAIEVVSRVISDMHPDIILFDYSRSPEMNTAVLGSRHLAYGLFEGREMNVVRDAVCSGGLNNLCTKVFRRTLFEHGIDYESYAGLMHGEDLLQLLPLVDAARSFCHIPDVLYYYRVNSEGSTASYKPSQLSDLRLVFDSAREYALQWGEKASRNLKGAAVINAFWLLRNASADASLSMGDKLAQAKCLQAFIEENEGFIDVDNPDMRLDIRLVMSSLISGKTVIALWLAKAANAAAVFKKRLTSI